jgi:hypothetical protein
MKQLKVENMINANGNRVSNQFILSGYEQIGDADNLPMRTVYTEVFKSYNSYIAKKQGEDVFLDINLWDCSTTTGKYRNIFLGETKKETEKKIKSGEYILVDLNQ